MEIRQGNLPVFSYPLAANRRKNHLKLLSSEHNSNKKKIAKKKRDLCTCYWKYDVIREADNLSTPVLSNTVREEQRGTEIAEVHRRVIKITKTFSGLPHDCTCFIWEI